MFFNTRYFLARFILSKIYLFSKVAGSCCWLCHDHNRQLFASFCFEICCSNHYPTSSDNDTVTVLHRWQMQLPRSITNIFIRSRSTREKSDHVQHNTLARLGDFIRSLTRSLMAGLTIDRPQLGLLQPVRYSLYGSHESRI